MEETHACDSNCVSLVEDVVIIQAAQAAQDAQAAMLVITAISALR